MSKTRLEREAINKIKKFTFVNGDVSESVDLESEALDCNVYHVEEIKIFRFAIASIYLLKNIFDGHFGEKFAENEHVAL